MKRTTIRERILLTIYFSCIAWISIGCFYQSVTCPKMTQTEVFLNIPEQIVFNFKQCE
jgi:hypothetical protein